jgi:DNA replication protein DnaC
LPQLAEQVRTGGIQPNESSNRRVFPEWGALFDVDNTLATALIDRLMHHGKSIVIRGDSYRMKDKDSDRSSA